jgi:shikimate dehydrogenase
MIKRQYGLIGYPLAHSHSGEIFREILTKNNIHNAEYRLYPIPNFNDLQELIRENHSLLGLNVTIPYKEKVIPLLNDLSDDAKAIGAVNCIKIFRYQDKPFTKGYNTDYQAFSMTLQPHLLEHHEHALILGTGGAALAVIHSLNELNIKWTQVSRSPAGKQLGYKQVNKRGITDYQIIINATPVGMYPESNQLPELPYENMNKRHLLYDLVYNPHLTRFLAMGEKMGAKTINGSEMLQLQAELSWKIWNEMD